jgi:hypothetical protein
MKGGSNREERLQCQGLLYFKSPLPTDCAANNASAAARSGVNPGTRRFTAKPKVLLGVAAQACTTPE